MESTRLVVDEWVAVIPRNTQPVLVLGSLVFKLENV
jgi:hypothetical protein